MWMEEDGVVSKAKIPSQECVDTLYFDFSKPNIMSKGMDEFIPRSKIVLLKNWANWLEVKCTSMHFFALLCTPSWECILSMHSQLGVHNFFLILCTPRTN